MSRLKYIMINYKKYCTSHQSMVNLFIYFFVFVIFMYSIKNALIFKIRFSFPSSSSSSSQSSSFEKISLSSMKNRYCGRRGHRRQFVDLILRQQYRARSEGCSFLTGFYSISATQARSTEYGNIIMTLFVIHVHAGGFEHILKKLFPEEL